MKKNEVHVGSHYVARVSGINKVVKVISPFPSGGWLGRVLKTGRTIRLRSCRRLKWEVQMFDGLWINVGTLKRALERVQKGETGNGNRCEVSVEDSGATVHNQLGRCDRQGSSGLADTDGGSPGVAT